jgi:hypothetical protein
MLSQHAEIRYPDRQNLDDLVKAMRPFQLSESFLNGVLFLLGAILMRTPSGTSPQQAQQAMQWLLPHDINEVSDDILGRMYDGQITEVIEEFFYRTEIEIPVREIRVKDFVTYLLKPRNHGLLPEVDLTEAAHELREVSKLYYAMTEEIGRHLGASDYTYEEAYYAGICFFGSWAHIDMKAVVAMLQVLFGSAPPVLNFVFSLPNMPSAQPSGWLPTQIALWGFVYGLDEHFMEVAWPYQSWLLFRNQQPIQGVEEMPPSVFLDHCYEFTHPFSTKFPAQIREVSHLGIGPDKVPAWTGSGSEKGALVECVTSISGYNIEDEALPKIERKQVNACIIFVLFCSLCRAASLN